MGIALFAHRCLTRQAKQRKHHRVAQSHEIMQKPVDKKWKNRQTTNLRQKTGNMCKTWRYNKNKYKTPKTCIFSYSRCKMFLKIQSRRPEVIVIRSRNQLGCSSVPFPAKFGTNYCLCCVLQL